MHRGIVAHAHAHTQLSSASSSSSSRRSPFSLRLCAQALPPNGNPANSSSGRTIELGRQTGCMSYSLPLTTVQILFILFIDQQCLASFRHLEVKNRLNPLEKRGVLFRKMATYVEKYKQKKMDLEKDKSTKIE